MKNVFQLLLVWLCLITIKSHSQTTYANREWVRETPVVGTGYYHTSTIVVSGKIYMTGNVVNGSGNTDIYTLKLDSNGDTLWSATYNGSATGSMDYGIELKNSTDGFLYVIGAAQNSSTGYDYCLIKYNMSTGSQVWVRNWNGTGNGDDIPSAIKVDGSSAIYVTGGSEATNGFSDYGTIKVSNLNVLGWAKYYNYNGLHDGATTITTNLTSVIVSGGSASAVNDWDIATVSYNKINGAAGTPSRTNVPGATMTGATAMTTDSLNNIYITGFAEISGDKNIQTMKLDSNLTLQWIADYEDNGEDVSCDLAIDPTGNIYITGFTEVDANKYKGITIKYQGDGDTLWTQLYGNCVSQNGVQFRKLALSSEGVFTTGTSFEGSDNSFVFVNYNFDGVQKTARSFESDSLTDDAFDIQVDGNSVYITGFTETIGGTRMTTVKYGLTQRDSSLFYASSGKPVYASRELIVRVDTSLINRSQVDDLGREYWTLDEIFDPSFVTNLERQLELVCDNEHCPITVYRIFSRMKTTDTISISRLGDTISIPPFWSAFLFELPEGIDLTAASDQIVGLFPDVNYSTYNLVGYLNDVPDDPDYINDQISLHVDYTPTAGWADSVHINVEPAWDFETGKRHIKIGVFDGPVEWYHEDFGGQFNTKVDGWSFEGTSPGSIYTTPTGFSTKHGTSVAGIIGAIRNNDMGVAGIVGGSYANGANLDSSGCALYGMTTQAYNTSLIYLNHIADAVYCSSVDNDSTPYSYGLHIQNHSWGISEEPYESYDPSPWWIDTNIVLLRDAFHFANRNGVVVVASRGNSGLWQDQGHPHNNTPGVLDDDWIICVGGLGTDGNYHDGDLGNLKEYGWKASRGPQVDVSCYSSGSHNWSTIDSSQYNVFNGTSAAAPHISGVAGLMLSYINEVGPNYNNLAPEDVEYIMQMTATDVNVTTHPGPDTLNGYGIVNAGAIMNQIKKDRYTVAHFGTDAFPDFTDFNLHSTNDTITLSERYQNEDGQWFLPYTPYIVDTYKISAQSGHQIFTNEIVVAQWPRPSSSNVFALYDSSNVIQPRERVTLDSIDYIWGYLTGYIYHVSDSLGNSIGWIPFDTTHTFDLTYTLLKYDTAYYLNNSEQTHEISAKVFPNPSTGTQTIVIQIDQPIEGQIRLLDMNGRIVNSIYEGKFEQGEVIITTDLNYLSQGVYFYALTFSDGRSHYIRTVKQ
jgi:hypothetical protein